MSDIAIKVESLGKLYQIGAKQERYKTFRDVLVNSIKRLTVKRSNRVETSSIWALKDISLEIKHGEVVGIIGRNGAGKSTLLKVLSHITEPTTGRVTLNGRVGSLLEVGTGFHPELTGRDNIYLNGAILGMKKTEIARKFDEIVDFAEIEKFLDTPVKRYSSGMYVRLAFAVAAYLEPEILLVDEVLAVGDVLFQKKCLNKMGNVAHEGRTVLFVSHNLGSVKSLCTRGLMLSEGKIIEDNDVGTTIEKYLSYLDGTVVSSGIVSWSINDAPGNEDFRLIQIYLENNDDVKKATFAVDESFNICIHYQLLSPQPSFRLVAQLMTTSGEIAFTTTDQSKRGDEHSLPGNYTSSCHIPQHLLNLGEYSLRLWAGVPGIRYLLDPTDFIKFSIEGKGGSFLHGDDQKWPGVVCPQLDWNVIKRIENERN